MSVAAVMLVRDEADIVAHTISHLLDHVDHVYVADNRSTDGTDAILHSFHMRSAVTVLDDPEIGYWQSKKTTALAQRALGDGHDWVIPCDADERWEVPPGAHWPEGARLSDYLSGVALDVQIVRGAIVNHVPTRADPKDPNPHVRIGWRQPEPQALGKVACRAHPDLTIHAGNHGADYGSMPALTVGGLRIRHYPWRTPDQYLRKIRNGQEAYAATDLPPDIGTHWRMWEGHDDDAIRDWFWTWGFEKTPPGRHGLVYDPARESRP
jgi:hypothetical protein